MATVAPTTPLVNPVLPIAPVQYSQRYMNTLNNVLNLYFNRLTLQLNKKPTFDIAGLVLVQFTGNSTGTAGQTFTSVLLGNAGTATLKTVAVANAVLATSGYTIVGNVLTITAAIAALANIKVQLTFT